MRWCTFQRMNIESFLDKHVLPHISSDKKRAFIYALIADCKSIPAAAASLGLSRQRGHIIYTDFLSQVVPHIDVESVRSKVDRDIYPTDAPWLKLLLMVECGEYWPSFIHDHGFIVRKSIVEHLFDISMTIRRRSTMHSVVDITDVIHDHPGREFIKSDDDILIQYIKASMMNSCPTTISNYGGQDYLMKIRQHDINKVLKMIYVAESDGVSIDSLYKGYLKHLNFIGSTHIMSEKEHYIFCTCMNNEADFKNVKKRFYSKDGLVYALDKDDNPLSDAENSAFKFFKALKNDGRETASSMEMQEFMINHVSIPSVRKMIGASCIVTKEDRDKYSLFK